MPLPNRRFLRLHATLAKVLHLSGAAGLFQILDHPSSSDSPAVRSKYSEDFMEDVLTYNRESISRTTELSQAVTAHVLRGEMILNRS